MSRRELVRRLIKAVVFLGLALALYAVGLVAMAELRVVEQILSPGGDEAALARLALAALFLALRLGTVLLLPTLLAFRLCAGLLAVAGRG